MPLLGNSTCGSCDWFLLLDDILGIHGNQLRNVVIGEEILHRIIKQLNRYCNCKSLCTTARSGFQQPHQNLRTEPRPQVTVWFLRYSNGQTDKDMLMTKLRRPTGERSNQRERVVTAYCICFPTMKLKTRFKLGLRSEDLDA